MAFFTNDYGNLSVRGMVTGAAIAVIGLTSLIGGCTSITNSWQTGEGDRVGMVNKLSKKGLIQRWKTYEGQMALEGISGSGDSLGANVWDFAIDNYLPEEKQQEFVRKLQDSMDSGQKVKIHYHQIMATWPSRSGSGYLIQSVDPINDKRRETQTQGRVESIANNAAPRQTSMGQQITLDGRQYLLRHDTSGKLKVTELKEVQ